MCKDGAVTARAASRSSEETDLVWGWEILVIAFVIVLKPFSPSFLMWRFLLFQPLLVVVLFATEASCYKIVNIKKEIHHDCSQDS